MCVNSNALNKRPMIVKSQLWVADIFPHIKNAQYFNKYRSDKMSRFCWVTLNYQDDLSMISYFKYALTLMPLTQL